MNPRPTHSNLSKCSNRFKTTCLLVSSISPARNTSSKIAYTYHSQHISQKKTLINLFYLHPPNSTYLVKVKHKIQLAHVAEEAVEHLDEEVDRLQIRELVVVGVDADAEEEAGVAPVDDLEGAELDEVGLVLLVAGGDEAVDLVWGVRF